MVQTICNIDRIKTISLYNILVELMDNTKNHAYTKKQCNLLQQIRGIYLLKKLMIVFVLFFL